MDPIPDSMIEAFADEVLRLRSEYEFATFWLGTRIAGPVSQEDALAIKRELNRRVGQRIEETTPGLVATLERPAARINLLYPGGGASIVRLRPLLVYGRYRKHSREIPQSKWPCRRCRGAGCAACGGTGKRFQRSVEEMVAAPILAVCRGTGTKMHSVGREDVDARMLGRGRPFMLELAMPRVRTFDLAPIREELDRRHKAEAEVIGLQFGNEDLLERMLRLSPDKTYRATIACLTPVRREAVERLDSLRDVELRQETPRRVLHRRANLVRRRVVRSCAVEFLETGPTIRRFAMTLRVQSGTYIKEFISGDEGRTNPSVSVLLDAPCDCAELDTLEVHCDPLSGDQGNGSQQKGGGETGNGTA